MFKITKVDTIPTRLGNGLKIKDFEIGCARIVDISVEGEFDLDKILNETKLSVGFTYNGPESPVLYFEPDFKKAKNYILVKITSNGVVTTIDSPAHLCELFGLSKNDAKMLEMYISKLAMDRQLVMMTDKDLDGKDLMYFTNNIDSRITEYYKEGDLAAATSTYLNILDKIDYRSEYESDSFIKMFLIAIITACQDRYNKVNREESLKEVANILSSITYWNDGQLLTSSILDIENYINDIKSLIRV